MNFNISNLEANVYLYHPNSYAVRRAKLLPSASQLTCKKDLDPTKPELCLQV